MNIHLTQSTSKMSTHSMKLAWDWTWYIIFGRYKYAHISVARNRAIHNVCSGTVVKRITNHIWRESEPGFKLSKTLHQERMIAGAHAHTIEKYQEAKVIRTPVCTFEHILTFVQPCAIAPLGELKKENKRKFVPFFLLNLFHRWTVADVCLPS